MPRKTTTEPEEILSVSTVLSVRLREGVLIISIAFAIFLLLAFATFHATDPGWTSTGSGEPVANLTGRVGAWFSDVFLFAMGYPAYLLPIMLVYAAWVGCFHRVETFNWLFFTLKAVGFLLVLFSLSTLFKLFMPAVHADLPLASGGMLGQMITDALVTVLNFAGTGLLALAVLLIGLTLFTGMSWLKVLEVVGRVSAWAVVKGAIYSVQGIMALKARLARFQADESRPPVIERGRSPMSASAQPFRKMQMTANVSEPAVSKPVYTPPKRDVVIAEKAKRISMTSFGKKAAIKGLPALDLLDVPVAQQEEGYSKADLQNMSVTVETTLSHFGVEVKVVAIQPGPIITRFELSLAAGIKVSKISGLSKDIARSLSVPSVRIVEVIAGKSVIGLELPNENREMIYFREVLQSDVYQQSHSPLTLTLGKDIGGHPVVVDLAKMPHLLVAGTTGSGKYVAVNAMVLSMIYKATPDQVRFIMIDPKMLELSIYEGIPHLLTPVITDMKEAANGLRWSVAEMDRRYRLMASLGVRSLQGYNAKVKEALESKKPLLDPLIKPAPGEDPIYLELLPSIVVVIDEFADMMMVVGKKVEELITRIAQKARAAGIHLLLATQRPSVDVITGIIKANIPTRIAFQVSSRVDSRTILDQQGAEQLLGHGDMLYLPPGSGMPIRVHGAFVSDDEVHRVVADWKTRGKPHFIESIVVDRNDDGSIASDDDDAEEADELYDKAVALVIESQRPSISYVQRRLKIGYNRSARLIEAMERAGLVSSMDQGGSREVLVSARPED